MQSASALFEKYLLKAPYRFLPLAVFILLEIHFMGWIIGHLPLDLSTDPDDYMRLNQTVGWLQGQGWFDLTQSRMSPGAHTIIHWSRLVDLPIALFMLPLMGSMSIQSAALTASLFAPVIPFVLLLILLPLMARPLMGRGRANLALLYLLAAPIALAKFGPGRVDHHNWEIVITCIGFLGLVHALLLRKGWQTAAVSAVAFALGLWIGGEILPVLAIVTACLGMFSAWRGGFALRNTAVFGLTLAVATSAVLCVALPVSEWSGREVSWFSSAYVILALLIGAALAANWLIGRRLPNRWFRLGLVSALGISSLMLFILLVPDAVSGPFANYDQYNSSTALNLIDEAVPFVQKLKIDPAKAYDWARVVEKTVGVVVVPGIAFFVAVLAIFKTSSRRRRMVWALNAVGVGGLLILGLAVQGRILWLAEALQGAPVAYLTWCWWNQYKKQWTLWMRLRAALLCFLLIGLLPVTIAPYFLEQLQAKGNPAKETPSSLRQAAEFIEHKYTDRTYTIMSGMDEGPGLLFFTHDNVIGGNFNVAGNPDAFDFFAAKNDEQSEAIARRWKIDLVLTRKDVAGFYSQSPDGTPAEPDSPEVAKTLIGRLVKGEIPGWLKSVEIPESTGYLLFEVSLPDASPTGDTQKP